jgi:hypothetical protein
MFSACAAVQAVCAAWELQGQDGAALVKRAAHPTALQAISTVLLALTLCPEKFEVDTPTAGSSKPRTTVAEVRLDTPDSVRASQAAWQYACTHQSDLTQMQQQALQALGCSGRALVYAAQHGLGQMINSSSVELTANAFRQMAQQRPSVPLLDQPQQLQQLAEALPQLKEGDSLPCGSQLLPCAALLWLVPAVLL